MTMKQALTLLAAVAAPTWAVAAPQTSAPPPHHEPTLPTAKPCTTTWVVTGRKVAVKRLAWNDGPVAKTTGPVHHYLQPGPERLFPVPPGPMMLSGPGRPCVVSVGGTHLLGIVC